MKLSAWAKKNGISYKTAYRWFKDNKLPVSVEQMPSGAIIINENLKSNNKKKYVIYARVSSHDQKKDLESQLNRLREFASCNGLMIHKEVSEIGSGLNDKRKKLLLILQDNELSIIVEHKDRLSRFGFNIIETLFKSNNREIIVTNNSDLKEDLVQDFIDIVTSMCAKIYGKRGAKNRANKALKAITIY